MFRFSITLLLTTCCLVLSMRQKSHKRQSNYTFGPDDLTADETVSVMTWNILARPYTKYNHKFHRNVEGREEELEAVPQTRGRYTLAAEKIVELSRDLVFLQECDLYFFKPEWNPAAEKVKDMYEVFPCYAQPCAWCFPGTAVLVKKNGSAVAIDRAATCIGGTDETGGPGKLATIVRVRAGSKNINAISTHFAGFAKADKRSHHLTILGDRLKQEDLNSNSLILGGDFNAYGTQLEGIENSSFLKDVRRAKLKLQRSGLSGDFKRQVGIDHLYVSKDLSLLSNPCTPIWNRLKSQSCEAAVLSLPANPWGETPQDKVVGASDHVAVSVLVKVV